MTRGRLQKKTEYQVQQYLTARRMDEGEIHEKAKLREWLASVCSSVDVSTAEVRELLIYFYTNIRHDEAAVEILSNPKILEYSVTRKMAFTEEFAAINSRPSSRISFKKDYE